MMLCLVFNHAVHISGLEKRSLAAEVANSEKHVATIANEAHHDEHIAAYLGSESIFLRFLYTSILP